MEGCDEVKATIGEADAEGEVDEYYAARCLPNFIVIGRKLKPTDHGLSSCLRLLWRIIGLIDEHYPIDLSAFYADLYSREFLNL